METREGLKHRVGRNQEIRIKVSQDEYSGLQSKSKLCGMTVSAYLRYVGLNSRTKVEIEELNGGKGK